MTDRVYLSPPDVGRLEEEHVLHAIRSGWVAPLGPDVDAFEEYFANTHVPLINAMRCGKNQREAKRMLHKKQKALPIPVINLKNKAKPKSVV